MAEDTENVEPRMIEFKCPYCGVLMSFPEMDAGLPQECPACMEILIVPRESCETGPRFPLPITTPRLNLRRVQPEDEAGIVALSADDDLFRYVYWSLPGEEQLYNWIQGEQNTRPVLQERGLWLTIEIQDGRKFAGLAWIRYFNDSNDQGQIQLVISAEEQRKGYGLEAMNGLLAFGFQGIGMRRMTLSGDNQNAAYMGLATKAGFRQEGEFIKERFIRGEWVTTAFFAMLKEEFGNGGAS
jgi:ribosomal-protein-alanine N-acetyltransferase